MGLWEVPSSSLSVGKKKQKKPFTYQYIYILFLTLSYLNYYSLDAGSATPELIFVHTPRNKEHARIPRKRKCLFDEKIVLSNEYAYREF